MKHTKKLFAAALALCLLAGCAAHDAGNNTGGTPIRSDNQLISPNPTSVPSVTDVPASGPGQFWPLSMADLPFCAGISGPTCS